MEHNTNLTEDQIKALRFRYDEIWGEGAVLTEAAKSSGKNAMNQPIGGNPAETAAPAKSPAAKMPMKAEKGKKKEEKSEKSEKGEKENAAKNCAKNEALEGMEPGGFETIVRCAKCKCEELKLSELKTMIKCQNCNYTDLVENVIGIK